MNHATIITNELPEPTQTIRLNGTDVAEKRREILEYFNQTWDLYERLFDCLADERAYFNKAISLRHPLIFYFGHTAIVKEKDARSYAALLRERALDPEHTWMIGNSPKSDINPALEAGIHAVFVPHARTWTLERAELREGPGRLLKIARFEELREYF